MTEYLLDFIDSCHLMCLLSTRNDGRRQAIIWTSAVMLSIEPLVSNFSEILIEIHTLSLKKMHLKMSSGKCRPFCSGLNGLIDS